MNNEIISITTLTGQGDTFPSRYSSPSAGKREGIMNMSTYISPQSLINLYIRLIKQGRVKKDGAGFRRLNQLIQNRGKK